MKKMKGSNLAQQGFTLIEIAIVLVIIGLLLGGVLQGQQLIENSRVRAAINDMNGVAAATYSYQDRFKRLPGDDGPLATVQGRGAAWANVPAAGDTNGVLGGNTAATFAGTGEVGAFFAHLKAAGLLSGDPSQTGAVALPVNPFGGATSVSGAAMMGAAPNALTGLKVCMSSVPGAAAQAMDTRLDDGLGATGRFRATLGAGAAPAAGALAAPYAEPSTYTVCYRI